MSQFRAIQFSDLQNGIVHRRALEYFTDRYIIGNLPRAPISQLDSPCHIWTAGKIGKYGRYCVSVQNVNAIFQGPAHRLSFMLFKGDPGEQLVLHVCQEELCVNPDHFVLGDHKLNSKHQLMNKVAPTHPHLSHANDLTTADVRTIRTLFFKHGYPISSLAQIYSKSNSCISDIIYYKTWQI